MTVTVILKDAQVFHRGAFSGGDVSVSFGDRVFCKDIVFPSSLNVSSFTILPGFVDVHVHLREPGFSYKETIRTGTLAAAHGGYTTVCAMPNLNPVPDSMETLQMELDAIQKDAVIRVLPYGAITKGEQGRELADLDAMAPYAVAFSDDGKGVQDRDMMRRAMLEAKRLGKLIVAHCEDNSLLRGGYIHDGAYARAHGHRGICSESEWRPIQRDLELVRETGCGYHVCHISTKESVDMIRKAKAEGLNVTCETGPHYLLLSQDDLLDEGRFKMNPPIRSAADRDALVEGLLDGTIDCIATDHAPHSAEEKSKGLHSLNGIVGLECAFSVLYTQLVEPGVVPFVALLSALCVNPRHLFRLPGGKIEEGEIADLTVLDLNWPHAIDSGTFFSQGRSTPFDGWTVTAHPDGTLTDPATGRAYYCLFWEGVSPVEYDFSEGFVVPGEDTAAFLEEALATLGLTDQEANEFLIYWLPKMEGNPYNLIAFQDEVYTENAALSISPAPDTLLRVFMAWKGLEEPVEVQPQVLTPTPRTGFTVVEWGGSEVQ